MLELVHVRPLPRRGVTESLVGPADALSGTVLCMAERVLPLSAEQAGAGTAVLAVVPPVTAVIAAILTAVATIVAAVIAALVPSAE